MSELIQHDGEIVAINVESVTVRILQASACNECRAKAMCLSADAKEKLIECELPSGEQQATEPLQVGDRVLVFVDEKLGWKAILLAYLAPFLVLIGVVAGLDMCVENEALVGTIALCTMGVYYIVLSFFKHKLQKQFRFWIERKKN